MVKFKVGDKVKIKETGFVVNGRSRIKIKIGDIKEIKEIKYNDLRSKVDITFTDGTGGYHNNMLVMNTQLELIERVIPEIILW